MTAGGKREGAGRHPVPAELRRVAYSTRLPAWIVAWLKLGKGQEAGPRRIEAALIKLFSIQPPHQGD